MFHEELINMAKAVLNLNVGILGHVDSGKTSLAKALSTTASTASFDKNPQSQERGITIDLGFSSLVVDMPEHLKKTCSEQKLQLTFVDCPGHASLIRTIIGGTVLTLTTSSFTYPPQQPFQCAIEHRVFCISC